MAFGIPIGCGIGIALSNLALGVGIGLLLGATVAVFQAKKAGETISPVVPIALITLLVSSAAFLALGFIVKK